MTHTEYEHVTEVFGSSLRDRYPRVFRKVYRYSVDLALALLKAEVSRMAGDTRSYELYMSQADEIVEDMKYEYGVEVLSRRFTMDGTRGRLYLEARVVYTRFGACFADYCWFDACALDVEDTYGEVMFAVTAVIEVTGRTESVVLAKLPVGYVRIV